MTISDGLYNFLNPPILFFFLGMCAAFFKVELAIPNQIAKFLSLYLMLAIGFHGGVALRAAGVGSATLLILLGGMVCALISTAATFFMVKKRVGIFNAAALAASYGSVSAVTFITALSFLESLSLAYSGTMVALMACMETPGLVLSLFFVQRYAKDRTLEHEGPSVWHEVLFDPSVFLIFGSLLIGFLTGSAGMAALHPFTHDIFKGMLSFFTLDMGIVAAKRMRGMQTNNIFLMVFACLMPLANAALGFLGAKVLGLPAGDAFLFIVLCASASYIAVPAVMRFAVPEADPSFYIPPAVGVTLPFNLIIGLPLYLYLVQTYL